MVFGIGEGKIEIETDKQSYTGGEKVKGKVRLTLNQPKKAKGLRIRFYGERRTTTRSVGIGTSSRSSTHIEQLYLQEISLGGEKEYPAGLTECDFEFALPSPQRAAPQGDNPLAGVINMLVGDPWANVRWYLDASLDLPMSLDINKKMQVSFTF
jgi:hypothetical protein